MRKLENAVISLSRLGRMRPAEYPAVSLLTVTLIYLVAVLGVPLYAPQKIIWLAVYPVVQAEMSGIGYSRVFRKSMWVLPLILVIGIFNPIIDKETAFTIGGVTVNRGWVSFFSIVLRGLLAVQAVILLALTCGFYDICAALRRLWCPRILVTQIEFTYRYLGVVAEEALAMDRARRARGFGRRSYPLGQWGRMVGQLLIRSYERATRIHKAMLARGFDGVMPASASTASMQAQGWIFLIVWTVVIIALRFIDFSSLISKIAI